MTTEQLRQLVSYLQERSKTNNQTQAASSPADTGGGLFQSLANAGIKQGIKSGIKAGWKEWGSPYWDKLTSSGTEAATEGTAAGVASGAGESSLSGLGGVSYGSMAGGALTVAAPLIMAYLNYQKGSGRNDPEIHRAETSEAGRQLYDLSKGKNIDQGTYSLPSKYLPGKGLGDWNNFNAVESELDPAGYSPAELYDMMHKGGAGWKKMLATGSSGQTDKEIDDLLYKTGMDRDTLSKLTGLDIPDWSQGGNYADWVQANNERDNPQGNVMGEGSPPPEWKDWRKLSKLLEDQRMIQNY
jgi:hypothetical protein